MSLKNLSILAAILLALGLIGNQDYKDELIQEQQYFKDVCDGIHPDYKNLKPKCLNKGN
mgnify:FL=1|tara:strand:- start:809 stop:985 length:177 start_codon:yes stop_codon:yes gene_type:complete